MTAKQEAAAMIVGVCILIALIVVIAKTVFF